MARQDLYDRLLESTNDNVTLLMGPPGCGKTRRARILAGPDATSITAASLRLPDNKLSKDKLRHLSLTHRVLIIEEANPTDMKFLSNYLAGRKTCNFIITERT